MSKSKSLYGNKGILIGAGLLGAYLVYKGMNTAKEATNGEGSLGGTDDLLGQQGFDVDPNSVPQQPYYVEYPQYYVITPEGEVVPNATPNAPTNGGSGIPSNVPLASTGTGSLFQDAAATGGAIGLNLMLPSIAKRINKLIDTKYLTDAVSTEAKQTPWNKFLSDPYGLSSVEKKGVSEFGDLAISKAEKVGSREVAELAIDKSGKTVLKTIPKWAKATKTVANFIPLVDIPIGAGLDVYFSRYEEDPTKKIDWWSAIKANTAGELAQLGITGGAAAASSVVPVAGTIAGGVGGFIVGTGADIAATEGAYAAMGKTSLFTGSSSGSSSSYKAPTAAQAATVAKLTGQGSYNFQTNTYTTPQGYQQSMSASAYLTSLATPAVSVSSSSGGGGSSSSSSSSRSSSSSSSATKSSSASTSSNVTASKSASTSSAAKSSTPTPTPKVSVVSRVTSVAKSVASKVSSWFRRK